MTHSFMGEAEYPFTKVMLNALKGALISVGSAVLMSLVCCAIALAFADPRQIAALFSMVVLAASSFIGGVFAMRLSGGQRFLAPAVSGGLYVLILWLLSFILKTDGDAVFSLWQLFSYVGCVLLSLFGGFIARKRRVRIGDGAKNPAALMRKKISAKK